MSVVTWLVKIFFWRRLRAERRFWEEAEVQIKLAQQRAADFSELLERKRYLQECLDRGENVQRDMTACEDALSVLEAR